MEAPARAPGYDIFKLIVAILLLILFLYLLRSPRTQAFTPVSTASIVAATNSLGPLTAFGASPSSSPPLALTAGLHPTQASTASGLQTPPAPPATAPPIPSLTGTDATQPTVTLILPPAETAVAEPLAPPVTGEQIALVCETTNLRSHLQVGTNATIRRRLNFRSSPGIRDNWLLTNLPGTPVKIIGGPECVPYWTGAYLWWQIQLPDGRIGWSAESSLYGSFYFIEPAP